MRILTVTAMVMLLSSPAAGQTADDAARARAAAIAGRTYVSKQISAGQNRPALNPGVRTRAALIVALRDGLPPQIAADAIGLNSQQLHEELEKLVAAGFLRSIEGRYEVAITVITAGDALRYFPVRNDILRSTAELLRSRLPAIKQAYAKLPSFRNIAFEDASLLILSDVMLDNWQINAVEKEVLHAERPLRAGGRYYLSVEEAVPWAGVEAFGIYGNQFNNLGAVAAGVYGNRRGVNDILSLPLDSLRARFGMRGPDSVVAYRRMIVTAIAAAAHDNNGVAPAALRAGLESFRLAENGRVTIPVLSAADFKELSVMAEIVRPELVRLLNEHTPFLRTVYNASPYAREITFEEYFIWWYHFYYSQVTDYLIASRDIERADSGVTTYVVVW